MDTTTKRVIENIRGVSKFLRRSNKNIAETVGIAIATYDRKINKTGAFTIEEFAAIADTLKVTPIDLFSKDLATLIDELPDLLTEAA
ncbi:hypothetical protein [Arthrobacter sp. S41]|uniref:hypothetical protein n=1 Tax=Arthrobacter sp. S41 TaxID=2509721 RepID=UPI0010365FBD|nr:hypothetical protein [Arthrobacter sp. S41]TAP26819.1 hypothetical protein EYR88_00160 [Arthrobacter sp. S41]